MPNVVRFALDTARDQYISGVGWFRAGILDVDANRLALVSKARYLVQPYRAVEIGIVDSAAAKPTLPPGPEDILPPNQNPYPQYLDSTELAAAVQQLITDGDIEVGGDSAVVLLPAASGGNDATAIHAALNANVGKVVRGRPGQTYRINTTLKLPSNSYLDMTGCTVKLMPGTNQQLIGNSAWSGGNDRITIVGGVWDYDFSQQTGVPEGNVSLGFDFRKCTNLVIRNLRIINVRKYAIRLADCVDFAITDIDLDTPSDGVHLDGGCIRGRIWHITGTTGDDFVALTSRDFPQFEVSIGDITDIDIRDLHPDEALSALKILGGTSTKLRRITADGLYGTTTTAAVKIWDDNTYPQTMGSDIGSLLVTNVYTRVTGTDAGSGVSFATVEINATVLKDVTIDGLSYDGARSGTASNQVAVIAMFGSGTMQDVNIRNVQIPGGNYLRVVSVVGCTVSRLNLENITVLGSPTQTHLCFIQQNATVTALKGHRLVAANNASQGGAIVWVGSATVTRIDLDEVEMTNGEAVVFLTQGSTPKCTIRMAHVVCVSGVGWVLETAAAFDVDFTSCWFNVTQQIVLATAAPAAGVIRGGAVVNPNNRPGVARSGTQAINVRNRDFPADLSILAKANGDAAFNTNAALACGVGPAITDGTSWKNQFSGATY